MNATDPHAAYSGMVRPVIDASAVADMLNVRTETFYNRRKELEANGFPPKLPGINGWSRECVLRWINTNGATFLPAPPAPAGEAENPLEARYGQ